MSQDAKLTKYLSKIRSIYDLDAFRDQEISIDKIVDYYTQSNPGYSFFHSTDGSVHMALSSNGEFSKDDYYAQVRFIDDQVKQIGARNVLELASGKGFNSSYLAQHNPSAQFTGIDITPVHLEVSAKKATSLSLDNVTFEYGDFHELKYDDQTFDLVFEIESVCHALDLRQVLTHVYRVLKPGGQFIIFDGLKKKSIETLTPDQRTAALLVEKSMAVMGALTVEEFISTAEDVGFVVVEKQDISQSIMPNLKRFEFLARGFFKYPSLGKLIKWALPDYLVQNAIAGLLMPIVVEDGIQGYFRIVLKRD